MQHSTPFSIWRARGRAALVFLTQIPLGRASSSSDGGVAAEGGPPQTPPPALAEAAGLFPLVGVVVGVIGALAYGIAHLLGLPPLLAALAAVGATVLATGALHEDGLADVADGFGGGLGRQRKLEIMRDSNIGSYGALALILSVAARVLALAALAETGAETGASFALVAGGLIAAHAAARAPLAAIMAWADPARVDGLGASAGRPSGRQVSLALGFGLLAAALAVGPFPGLAVLVAACLGAALLLTVARAQIGGYTGDLLGAVEQLGEIIVLLTMVCLT